MKQTNQIPGLYDPSFEHDNCGIGACVNIKGVKNHQTVDGRQTIQELSTATWESERKWVAGT